jgi:hypothetical protein
MKKYSYAGSSALLAVLSRILGALGLVLAVPGAIALAMLGRETHSMQGVLSCLALWELAFGGVVSLSLLNLYPTVWVGHSGLVISAFLLGRVTIPWQAVIDVQSSSMFPLRGSIVRARRITPFHRLYGWLYSPAPVPAFVIDGRMRDYDELILEINRRARATPPSAPSAQ